MNRNLLTWTGYLVSFIATFFCFLIFYYDTQEFWKSLAAAAITGGLVLGTYMVLRWLVLASRS